MASSTVDDDGRPVVEDNPPRFRFAVGSEPAKFKPEDAPGFICSINNALARHADADHLESLEISLIFHSPFQYYSSYSCKYFTDHPHAAVIWPDHVKAWLCYGMRRAVKSLVLEVPPRPPSATRTAKRLRSRRRTDAAAYGGMALELLGSAVAETMALTLGNATLTLPVPAEGAFLALTDLLLSNARINDGPAGRLGALLSSRSCPQLQRLRLEHLLGVGVAELELCAGELEELTILNAPDLWRLKVVAPRLRELLVTKCYELRSDRAEIAITAPVLEVLACPSVCKLQGLQFSVGATSVREIQELPLWTHGHADADHVDRNNCTKWILLHCPAAHHLGLHLYVPDDMTEQVWDAANGSPRMVANESILMDDVPMLPNVTTLTVVVWTWEGHSYGAGLAKIIANCSNLEYISINVITKFKHPCSDKLCVCNRDEDGWKDLQATSLKRLRKLSILGFRGLDYEKRLVRLILDGAPPVIGETSGSSLVYSAISSDF